ncbi:30S ribosomal protein S6 [Candidatus Phytoplasma melaleucae]|uniref:Small ribosomal subunit protein bS6 n=1 Tax=Candidatus Phytoplasma melaleucae TaxID=2982630 RepID=A0ABT9DDS4_9MOLU|nr:30S ribosomal protein S6 ['Melaleuca sp.' phytoplasma]MDO8167989.1 30S ribosomal protein S6 ['Melaleuca sp.' phytoplasma]MDV3205377.1 30S ribosomal protein S6 [Weeping tea tree witches'-broom phytoplasma]
MIVEYEVMYILKPNIDKSNVDKIISNINDKLKKDKDIEFFEEINPKIEFKKLAYPIKKFEQGYYVWFSIKTNNQFVEKLNNIIKITEEVIRFICVKS